MKKKTYMIISFFFPASMDIFIYLIDHQLHLLPYQQLEFRLVPISSGETMTKLIRISYFRKRTKLTQATLF